jgi:hypothetical protein
MAKRKERTLLMPGQKANIDRLATVAFRQSVASLEYLEI